MNSTSSGDFSAFPIIFFLVVALFSVAGYVFYSYCLKRIVEKCGERTDWTIWVPIVQMLPLFRVAKMNPWLILLMFVPVANVVVAVLVWINVLKVLGRDPVMVIVVILFGFIYVPYLALSSDKRTVPAAV